MKLATVLLICFIAGTAFAGHLDDFKWKAYKARHNKQYNVEEDKLRKEIFLKNLKYIQGHNEEAKNGFHKYTLGANRFADMTNEEFRALYNGLNLKIKLNRTEPAHRKGFNVPDTVDWRTHKPSIIGPVKNQEQCGSCWAFSATGSIESQHALKTGKYVSLSEQQLVDCSTSYGNNGCGGGLMDNAFKYVIDNKGQDTEASYPYEGVDGECRFKKADVAATISDYKDIPQGDESALKEAVASIGPISVAIDAGHQSFQLYDGGVYDEEYCSSTALDHGVIAVGYGTDNGQDYWLVRNSWGGSWGENGYIRMSRNKDNQCGIATMASYPIV